MLSPEDAFPNLSLHPRLAKAVEEAPKQAGVDVWTTFFPTD